MNKTITLLVNAIEVIQEIVRNRTDVVEDFDGNTIVNSKYIKAYSKEEIRIRLNKNPLLSPKKASNCIN